MKPRRLLSSVDLLPTISETHEEHPQAGPAPPAPQSLQDYADSIKALARPASAPGCGPVRPQRTQRPRLFAKHAPCPAASRRATRVRRPRAPDAGVSPKCDGRTDPLDWLFAQTQTQTQDAAPARESVPPAALRLL